ncbi:hypothetical protein AC578_1794 [Pseudocercospora eumusae]|uniref:Methyltransferase domain-containing protein n=1 Tax=Pseudocercospora eumusae TaxID=321146 RepID=A0A139GWL1_9PEZI|nr:hypothetical protein AC578_1794 [Pseudocercospora eumusae]
MQRSAGLGTRRAVRVIFHHHLPRYASQKSSPPPPPSPQNALKQNPRKLPWVLASVMGGVIAFYAANLYVAATQPCQNAQIADLSQQKDVVARYDETADSFDSDVGFSEWLMGVNKNRRQLARMCHGHVLEVSCGTGRNLGYYDYKESGRVESLTFVDISPQMIQVCKRKWMALFQSTRASVKHGMSIRFLPASALGPMPLAPTEPPRKYDTIIQTMGLCSTPSPVELLENMVKYLDTSNPDSKILLLEHGRSYQDWLNRILDNSAEKHAEIHGCWFNRDIGALVAHAAANTGLEVVRERRRHFGTTWLFELRPKGSSAETTSASQVQSEQPEKEQQMPAKRWFGFSDTSKED